METSQVGVLLCYVNLKLAQGFWTWVSGKLFLPECWFGEAYQARRQQLGIPADLKFKTKVELAWDGIQKIIGQEKYYLARVSRPGALLRVDRRHPAVN